MGGNPHEKTKVLFEMLGHYKWDAKAVLVLSAFATSYGEFWLIMQLYPCNPLAASIALLKQLPKDLCLLKHPFKVLNVLMKMIVDLIRHSNSITIASWELSSLVETKMHNKLLDLSKESHIDNQEVLEMLFALKDSLPLKDSSSQAKVEEDQNLCIYGSNNIDWIREFNAKMRNMTSAGLQLKMVYVGKKNSSDDHMKNILATMYEEKLTSSLTCTKIYFFWLRLESMRRSKLRLGHTDDHKDEILKQLSELLDTNDESEKGWVLLGKGSSTETLKLQGRKIMECLDLFQCGEKMWL
ncbi:Protein SIEVE ELEMENT OCCLUSION C [Camellia lanceoleosa]|uniref:Protein SIEVE ELEMENT OCCLUSION C n=1 Tax=Camellia lanceoleosa TaxID=1840588 RepID=A0ACC0HRX7_9ERIC|nr:Protein SIEVE ELEMENT OCCLUSION C [Camellia lanceoleosa]